MKERNKVIDEVCDFLKEVLFTDIAETNTGLNALFPSIIMCEKYFTVDDLINALKEKLGYEEGRH